VNKPEWFPFYVRKFSASSTVARMTVEGIGAYILLLCVAWHEEPAGSLPDDDKALAVFSRMKPARWAKVREEVLRAFVKGEDGRWHQPTMQREAEKSYRKMEAASAAGRASAAARGGGTTPVQISTIAERPLNDRATARVGVGVGVSSSGDTQDKKTTPTPTASVERPLNDRCPELTPEQQAVYWAIMAPTKWLPVGLGWVDEVTARELAVLPTSSVAFVEHVRADIRGRVKTLTNPAGVFVKAIKRADPGLIQGIERKALAAQEAST